MLNGIYQKLSRRLVIFREDLAGSLSVEAALMLPLLFMFYVISFVWYDAFKTQNTNMKASYTLADLISRQQGSVSKDYLDGLSTVYAYLANARSPTSLRVTVLTCDQYCNSEANRELSVRWPYVSTDDLAPLSSNDIMLNKDKIPMMVSGDTVILLETFMDYKPLFNAGFQERTFHNFIATRPRNTPNLVLETGTSGS